MNALYINAGIYLYRDHYIKLDRESKRWRVFPQFQDEGGISLPKIRTKKKCMARIDGFHRAGGAKQGALI